ncbi:MAG: P-loop NTPase [bacterium]
MPELIKPSNGNDTSYQRKVYAIASGKGGVGKTVTAASLGVGLASLGSEVILVDADFGGANLHTCMGVLKPEYNFDDFYSNRRKPLADFIVDTPVRNLRMISGSCGSMSLANLKYHQKLRLIRGLKKLPADHIIMDLGAGSDFNVIDLFLLADAHFLIVSAEPAAIHEAFGFLRICLFRGFKHILRERVEVLEVIKKAEMVKPGEIHLTIEELLNKMSAVDPEARFKAVSFMNAFEPKIIVNKVRTRADLDEGLAIQYAAWELLSMRTEYVGYISFDEKVSEAVRNFKPFLLYDRKARASQDMSALIRVKFLGKKGLKDFFAKRRWHKKLLDLSFMYPDIELSKDALICSDACFYWGDCDYQDEGNPCQVRHLESMLAH